MVLLPWNDGGGDGRRRRGDGRKRRRGDGRRRKRRGHGGCERWGWRMGR